MRARLLNIEERIRAYQAAQRPTVFLLESGATFTTTEDPVSYLFAHGVETPRGRIVAYPHPVQGVDALSASLYELIDEGIRQGGLLWPPEELESDTP